MTVPAVALARPLAPARMVAVGDPDPLSPIRATLRALAARPGGPPMRGIAPNLTVLDGPGWIPAADLVSGASMDEFLDTAKQRWRATPHAAAALAWKCYSYWLSLPAVIGYAAARRVPLVRPEAVRWRSSPGQPFLVVGLTGAQVAVLPSDPLAAGTPEARSAARVRVVADERELLAELRASLLDEHLTPLLEQVRRGVHVSARTFWGSLASGVAHGVSRAADVMAGPSEEYSDVAGRDISQTAEAVLGALGVSDLVELGPREGGRAGIRVRRRTCCLAFTLPEPRVCAGCCIR